MGKPLIEIQGLRKTYGGQTVLAGVDAVVSEGEKIAFIGRNGAGKTTLFRVITGLEEPDAGAIRFLPAARVGVVEQHATLPLTMSAIDYLDGLGHKPRWEISKLAKRFGLGAEALECPMGQLSGGYQMRVKLVAMLLPDPNILFLDEPVNYLDLQTLLLLEQFLREFRGSLVLIAHDRELLENICTHTWELERGELKRYSGTVSEYLDAKEEHKQFLVSTNKRLRRDMAHQQAFVDRFRAKASLATRAQSKAKQIEKLRRQIADIRLDLATVRMHIACPPVPNTLMLQTKALAIGYGDHALASGIDLEVMQGEKVVILGENGRGKSTLIHTLAGRIPPLAGQVKWWHKARLGVYSQHTNAMLVPTDTVLNHLERHAPEGLSGEAILRMAGNFLFRDRDLEKRIEVLSGGERARLALAGILLSECSVLLLDEPTNHLDVETAEVLAAALKEYSGTVLFVSHARTFVHTVATRLVEVRPGCVRPYHGSYDDYVADAREAALADAADGVAMVQQQKAERAEKRAERRSLEREQLRLQERLATLDVERSAILAFFFDHPTDYAPDKTARLQELDAAVARIERDWLAIEERLAHGEP